MHKMKSIFHLHIQTTKQQTFGCKLRHWFFSNSRRSPSG